MSGGRRLAGRLAATFLVTVTMFAFVGAAPVLDAQAAGQVASQAASQAASWAASQQAPPKPHRVLALGDSVPAGTACGCTAFPKEYGSLLSRRSGARVDVDNEAVSGLDTTGLLAQLQQPPIRGAVRRTDVFLLTIGANDFADHHDRVVNGACAVGSASDCVGDELVSMRTHLSRALAEIRALRAGRPTSVLVTGYWNVFEDGQVARDAEGAAGLRSSLQLTRRVNEVIKSVSTASGADYVDLFAPFQHQGGAIGSLLAPDGDHPDAAGHRLIAARLLDAGLSPTS